MAHTDTVIQQAPYYGSVMEQDEAGLFYEKCVMNITSY